MRQPFIASPDHDDAAMSRDVERALKFAMGVAAGLHPGTRPGALTVGATERLLLLGPQTTPLGVTVEVLSGGVMQTL